MKKSLIALFSLLTVAIGGYSQCELNLAHNPTANENCLASGLIVALDYPDVIEFNWSINGEILEDASSTSYEYLFTEPGIYEICFTYESMPCEEAVIECIAIEVEGCSSCPSLENFYAGSIEGNCLGWVFEIGSFMEGESVLWDFGDGTSEEGGHFADHSYLESGVYIVTAEYSSNDCPDGVELSVSIEVSCDSNCGLEVEVNNEGCGYFIFEAYGYPENANIYWEVNEVIYDENTSVTDIQFESEEAFNICAFYETPECPEGVWNCFGVEPELCDPCPTQEDFYANHLDGACLDWVFEIGSFMEGESVLWNFGDGTEEEGGHFADHSYEEAGLYIVTAFYTSNDCPEGVELIYTIEVENCDPCPDLNIEVNYNECGVIALSSNVIEGNNNVNWYINGEYIENDDYVEFEFEPGEYQICALYESDLCPEGVEWCETFVFENCDEGCPTQEDFYAGTFEGSCYHWAFEIGSFSEGESVVWEYGDGTEEIGGHYTDHTYNEPGFYVVTAYYTSNDCPDGVVLVFTIEVENCNDCPNAEQFYADNMEGSCYNWEFEIGSFMEGENAIWYFGDGVVSEGGHYITHEYEESGVYEVCVFYTSDACPDGVEVCQTIEVFCEGECVLNVNVEVETCEYFVFNATTNNEEFTVDWLYDGEYLGSGYEIGIGFSTEGWHTVCAIFETPECPEGIEWCEEYYIDYDDCECTEVGFAFDSYLNEGGPEHIGWSIYNQNTDELEEVGECNYNLEDPYCDAWVCLPDGCYEVVIWGFGNEWDGSWEGLFSAAYIGGDMLETYDYYSEGSGYVSYEFSLNSDCGEEPDCFLYIEADQVDEDSWIFSASVPEGVEVTWDFGDGNSETANIADHTFAEPGVYVVCASYESEACPDGVTQCYTVIVEDESCTETTIVISAEINEFELELIAWYLESEGFVLEGDIPLTSISGELALTYCVPDGCYSFGVEALDGLLDLANLEVDIYVGEEWIAGLSELLGEDGGNVEFGINDDCLVSVDEILNTELQIYPNPASDGVNIKLGQTLQMVRIHDASGRLVYQASNLNGIIYIDTKDWSNGIYQISVLTENIVQNQKLMIAR